MIKAQESYQSAYDNCKRSVSVASTNTADKKLAAAKNNVLTKKGELDAKMSELRSACIDLANDDDPEEAKKKRTAALIGAGVTAVAGSVLAYKVTKSIQDSALDKAEQAAIQEFMDNVGSKIRCYIGGEEVGTYGDVISTSME
jgi:hypothetical protein